MFKLIRFLRPFIGSVLLIFALLFVQAMTDLELPSYMSGIVNDGIQMNGVSRAVPDALRSSQMDHLLLLLSDSEAAQVKPLYRLLDRSQLADTEYQDLIRDYPLLASENIYIRQGSAGEVTADLEKVLARALAMLSFISSGKTGTSQMPANLPAGTDLFSLLARMTAEQRSQMLTQASQQLSGLPASSCPDCRTA